MLPANIVVENRAGGQGTVGSDHVRQSPPDGHTLLFSASIFALGRHILKSTRYDPQADFQPVARVGEAPLLVLAANSVPANTLSELIASAKREPQRYSFALSSLGAAGHLATLEFNRLAGVDISMVPYRGAAAALTDLGSNSVQLFIDAGVAALQQVRAGRMKVLAITTAERSPLAPEVPTAAESGLPGFVFNSWYGVWGPRGLPPAVLDKLADGLQRTVANEEVRRQFTTVGTVPAFDGPAAFTAFMARDIERNVALLTGREVRAGVSWESDERGSRKAGSVSSASASVIASASVCSNPTSSTWAPPPVGRGLTETERRIGPVRIVMVPDP